MWNNTILWITHLTLLAYGYGYEHQSTDWQQFVDLVFQDDIINRKQNFDVIKDDTFIHSTKEEQLQNITPQMPIFQEENSLNGIRIPFIEVHLKLKDETPFFV